MLSISHFNSGSFLRAKVHLKRVFQYASFLDQAKEDSLEPKPLKSAKQLPVRFCSSPSRPHEAPLPSLLHFFEDSFWLRSPFTRSLLASLLILSHASLGDFRAALDTFAKFQMALYAGVSAKTRGSSPSVDVAACDEVLGRFSDLVALLLQNSATSHSDPVFHRLLEDFGDRQRLGDLLALKLLQGYLSAKQDLFKSAFGILQLVFKSLVKLKSKPFISELTASVLASPLPLLILHLYSLYLDKECIHRFKNLQSPLSDMLGRYYDFIAQNRALVSSPDQLQLLLLSLSNLTKPDPPSPGRYQLTPANLLHRSKRLPSIISSLLGNSPGQDSDLLSLLICDSVVTGSTPHPLCFYTLARHSFSRALGVNRPLGLFQLTLDCLKRFFLVTAPLLESLKSNKQLNAFHHRPGFPSVLFDSIQGVMLITSQLRSRLLLRLSLLSKNAPPDDPDTQTQISTAQSLLGQIDSLVSENWQISTMDKERSAYHSQFSSASRSTGSSQPAKPALDLEAFGKRIVEDFERVNLLSVAKLVYIGLSRVLDSEEVLEMIESSLEGVCEHLATLSVASVSVLLKFLSSQDASHIIFSKLRLLGAKIIRTLQAAESRPQRLIRILRFVLSRSHDLKSCLANSVVFAKISKLRPGALSTPSAKPARSRPKYAILLNPSKQRSIWARLQLQNNCRLNLTEEESKSIAKYDVIGGVTKSLFRAHAKVRGFLDGDHRHIQQSVNLLGDRRTGRASRMGRGGNTLKKRVLYAKLSTPKSVDLKQRLGTKRRPKHAKLGHADL